MSEPAVKELDTNIVLVGVDFLGEDSLEKTLEQLIDVHLPETVAFALCDKRFEAMGREEWKEKALLPSYKEGKTGEIIYQAFTDAIKENLRRFKGLDAEKNIAKLVPMADKMDVDVEFIDRDVSLTLGRAFRVMSPVEKLKMFWYLKSAMLSFSPKKRKESIEELEYEDDLVGGLIEKLSHFAPKVASRAHKERTEYMGKRIYESSKRGKVLAMVPTSKIEELEEEIENTMAEEAITGEDTAFVHLEQISKRVATKAVRFISPLFFISLAIYLFIFSDVLNIWRSLLYWFLAVGGMAALGALLGRGHPLSVLISFLLAPFMSLTLIGPGWIAGYVELRVRNPSIADLKSLTASESTNEFLSNNIIRIFTVGVFSNIFTWVGLFIILPLLIRFVG